VTWFRIAFEEARTHCVSQGLAASLIIDMAGRGHPIENYEKRYGFEHAESLGGNPKLTTEWGFDMGGMCHQHEPREVIEVERLAIEVPCYQWRGILNALSRCTLRTFESGESYYKLHLWMHATVMTPSQFNTVVRVMEDHEPIANRRYGEFDAALKRAQQQGVS
jgi:hypothetical protein